MAFYESTLGSQRNWRASRRRVLNYDEYCESRVRCEMWLKFLKKKIQKNFWEQLKVYRKNIAQANVFEST